MTLSIMLCAGNIVPILVAFAAGMVLARLYRDAGLSRPLLYAAIWGAVISAFALFTGRSDGLNSRSLEGALIAEQIVFGGLFGWLGALAIRVPEVDRGAKGKGADSK